MRVTLPLLAHHIGRRIKWQWYFQGKIRVQKSLVEKNLGDENIKLWTVNELDEKPREPIVANFPVPREIPLDENHPDYKRNPCYVYGDNDVVLEGLDQARVLTKTEEVPHLPPALADRESETNISDEVHTWVQKKVLQSCVFDAAQEKLPKRKDPERPAWNFPRDYGITSERKIRLLFENFLDVCEEHDPTFEKTTLSDAVFSLPITAHGKDIQFELTSEMIVRSRQPLLQNELGEDVTRKEIPNLHPLHCTISLAKHHFYTQQDLFPHCVRSNWPYIHTAFIGHDRSKVKNLFEEEVLDTQILGRNLLKAFCICGAQARALYGENAKDLAEPLTLQLVMTDGKLFHFSVFQLNTLDVDNEESPVKNIYWNSPFVPLYESCAYVAGKPVLLKYNGDVIRRIIAFYTNK